MGGYLYGWVSLDMGAYVWAWVSACVLWGNVADVGVGVDASVGVRACASAYCSRYSQRDTVEPLTSIYNYIYN